MLTKATSWSASQQLQYPFNDGFSVFEHFVVPKANDVIPLPLKPLCAPCIRRFLVGVLPTIEFNDDALLEANEVDDEGSKGRLAAEPMTVKLAASYFGPQSPFCVSAGGAKMPCSLVRHVSIVRR